LNSNYISANRYTYRFVRTHDKNEGGELLKYIGNRPNYNERAEEFVPAPVEKG
jgi:hypothetical protein